MALICVHPLSPFSFPLLVYQRDLAAVFYLYQDSRERLHQQQADLFDAVMYQQASAIVEEQVRPAHCSLRRSDACACCLPL